ncbi:PEP-CTERM sorting domain-containing protein [Nibricoccus sp. IMCC34717]|uniref:PEP-CTERM sorting domain-containing protein n=1 Tax=Nibricoccus sp. IMCC34717 TaxID=3034021 RepID=UPI00384F7DFA
MKHTLLITSAAAAVITGSTAFAQTTGPSSSQSPYVQATTGGLSVTSVLTTGDSVAGYRMSGIPDGLGAYDNGDGTFTVLMNHELGSTVGTTRAHGSKGAFVSEWVVNKSTFAVTFGSDLIKQVYSWDSVNGTNSNVSATLAFNRFCSADLAPTTAYYNASSGLGTSTRIFLNGEEGGSGRAWANVATGADKGKTYELGNFAVSGATTAWENLLANPYAQDKTVVIGNNDGGAGAAANKLALYVGNKSNSGTEVQKAGLVGGVTKWISVAGATSEINDTTNRTTGIANGTTFTLTSAASGTAFSRPEDGHWNPLNPNQYFFVTTDQLDKTDLSGQTQKGGTRLWRLTFNDITNPDAGGKIDVMLDSSAIAGGVGNSKPNMFDNMTVTADGKIILQEDTGNAEHNAKIWMFDPATSALTQILKHDPLRFGDINGSGAFTAGTLTKDEESSGVIDISAIMADGNRWLLLDVQNHLGSADAELVEGGQLVVVNMGALAQIPEPSTYAAILGVAGLAAAALRRRKSVAA